MSSICAIIDIGTVTCRLMVAKLGSNNKIEVLHKQTTIVNLGYKVDEAGEFQKDNLSHAVATINTYKKIVDSLEQRYSTKIPIQVVATSASRDASNSHLLIQGIGKLGLGMEIITGEQEAKMTFMGASLVTNDQKKCVVLDIGGGSTEIISGLCGAEPSLLHSFNIGCRRISERFYRHDPPLAKELELSKDYVGTLVCEYMEQVGCDRFDCDQVIAVAGTATTLVAIKEHMEKYDSSRVHGYGLTLSDVKSIKERLASLTTEKRKEIVGLHPQRADVIVAGTVILEEILHLLHADSFMVSETDLLHGALLHYFAK